MTVFKRVAAAARRNAFALGVAVTVFVVLGSIVWFSATNVEVMEQFINPSLWVVSNMTLIYAALALVLWVYLYGFRFRWNTTPAGTDVFWFTLALLGVVALSFIGVFVNGRQPWYIAPPDLLVWRPFLRYLVYTGVAITLTRMDWSLIQRLRGRQPLMFEVVPRERERDREPRA